MTDSEKRQIDAALAAKRSPVYQEGYDACKREVVMLAAAGMSAEQIKRVLEGERA